MTVVPNIIRLCNGVQRTLAAHRCVIAWIYVPFALCAFWYVLSFADEVGHFAVNISEDEWRHILEPSSMGDSAKLASFQSIVRLQLVAVVIFLDSAADLPMIMFYLPLVFLLLVGRDGRVPLYFTDRKRGVKWAVWIIVWFCVFVSMGLVVRKTFASLLSSAEISQTEQQLSELFQTYPTAAIMKYLDRRRVLAACSILHLAALMGIAIPFLTIPFLRVLWANRYWSLCLDAMVRRVRAH